MRWTVRVVAEAEAGQAVEHEIASVERGDWITPATLGLSLAEGKDAAGRRPGETPRKSPPTAATASCT